MKKYIEADNITLDKSFKLQIDIPSKCPRCGTSFCDEPLYAALNYVEEPLHEERLFAMYFCPACERCFYTDYDLSNNMGEPKAFIQMVSPLSCINTSFPKSIEKLSPKFVSIYTQAEKAEQYSLDDICGLGYRKALEFLIKDYAIHESPNDAKTIKSLPLSRCIKTYISENKIKLLAERSTWIGNDEAHYVKKQNDRDVADMKKFIEAAVYFISMVLITEDAASMSPKKVL